MGRSPAFAADRVVRSAREEFWRSGYEGASIPALERATGLNRSSLYHAFGSKRGLFDAAVGSYLDDVVRPRLRPLVADDVAPDAVVDYFTGLRAALARPGEVQADSGCLLVNASSGPIGHDQAVRQTVAGYRAELRTAIGHGVDARFPERDDAARGQLADVCTSLVISAFVLVRVDPPRALGSLGTALELLGADGR